MNVLYFESGCSFEFQKEFHAKLFRLQSESISAKISFENKLKKEYNFKFCNFVMGKQRTVVGQ